MILDTGICTIFREEDVSLPGYAPSTAWVPVGKSWFSELSFETTPVHETERREDAQTDQRIRIHQMRCIRANRDVVVLRDIDRLPAMGAVVYRITRAYHGRDDEAGTLISDLSLREVSP